MSKRGGNSTGRPKNQPTIFQAWRKSTDQPSTSVETGNFSRQSSKIGGKVPNAGNPEIVTLSDDEDSIFLEALDASMQNSRKCVREKDAKACPPDVDIEAAKTWYYPADKPERSYQYNIAKEALCANTLVCLPTGLGKTLIASVVMYNFYRVRDCPLSDMAREGVVPCDRIRLLVMDEAHKATGQHAYCKVVNALQMCGAKFRLLALSATPGSKLVNVQQVVNNLLIGRVECRTEESIDVNAYVHGKSVTTQVVELSEEVNELKRLFESAMDHLAEPMFRSGILYKEKWDCMSPYKVTIARQSLDKRRDLLIRNSNAKWHLSGLASMLHNYDILLRYGQRALYSSLLEILGDSADKKKVHARTLFVRNEALMRAWWQSQAL